MQWLCTCRAFQLVGFTIGLLVWGIKPFEDSAFATLLTQGFPPFEKLAFLIYYISSVFCYYWFSFYTYLFSFTLTSFHGKDDWRRASSPIWLVLSWVGKFNDAGWATGWMVLNARLGSLVLNCVDKEDLCTQSNLLKITTNVPDIQPYLSSLFLMKAPHL